MFLTLANRWTATRVYMSLHSIDDEFEVAALPAPELCGNYGLKSTNDKNTILTSVDWRLLFYKGFVHCRTIYLIFRDIPFKKIAGIHSNKFIPNILTKGMHWHDHHVICPRTFWVIFVCLWLYFIVLKWIFCDISSNRIFWHFFGA